MRRLLVLLLCLAPLAAAAAPKAVTEAEVKGFLARQSRAWNAGDLGAYFALFAPEARFTDLALGSDGKVHPYGTSTLAEARAQAGRFFAGSKVVETTTIRSIAIAADGRSARIASDEVSLITGRGRPRRDCAKRLQTVVGTPAGLRSLGETDTAVRCR